MKKFNGLKVFNADEVTEKLDISKASVLKYLRTGRIVGQKIGQRWWVTTSNLNRFIKGDSNNLK